METQNSRCPACQNPVEPGTRYCITCGATLPPAQAAPPAGAGQKGFARPENAVWRPGQPPPPARPNPLPAQSGPPVQSGPPPAQSGPPQAQSSPPQAQSGPPPMQSSRPPAQSGPPPAQSGQSLAQSSPPPAQSGPPQVQSSPPPQSGQQWAYGQGGPPPAQYSYAPPAGPPAGYAPPAYGGYPYAGPAYAAPAYAPPRQPALPKRSKLPLVLMAIGIVVVVGVAGVLVWLLNRPDPVQTMYGYLVNEICSAATPEEVSEHAERLAVFDGENPGIVDADLKMLVEKCAEYAAQPPSDRKYINMRGQLDSLRQSWMGEVAVCAETLLGAVDEEDAAYRAEAKQADEEVAARLEAQQSQGGGSAIDIYGMYPISPDYQDYYIDVTDEGTEIFSFTFMNQTDLPVEYYEVWVYCYDAEGNPITGQNGESLEWVVDELSRIGALEPGEILDKEDGYWQFSNCENVQIIVPFINYIEFADGTSWGFTDDGSMTLEELEAVMEFVRTDMDLVAQMLAEQTVPAPG